MAMDLDAGALEEQADEDARSQAMVSGIHQYLLRQYEPSALQARRGLRITSAGGTADAARAELRQVLGIVPSEQPRNPVVAATADIAGDGTVAMTTMAGGAISATGVSWPAFTVAGATDCTAHGEGIWLRPTTRPVTSRVIVIPDADHSPERASEPGGYALRLAEAGHEVLVVCLIDRGDTFSGSDAAQSTAHEFGPVYTNQPHREWLHRSAFEMGRTLIGYEVSKVLAAVEALSATPVTGSPALPIGVFGYGEGGMLALHVSALPPTHTHA